MPSFIYNPGVQVYIQTSNADGSPGAIYDVSEDLVSGELIRRTNGVSTFTFVMQNNGRKYDWDPIKKQPRALFAPNDKIIVNMKRIQWLRVFTGYLNSVPVFQAWPGNINIEASCTLKRLQNWYWDPDSAASFNLITSALEENLTGTQSSTGLNTTGDAGIKAVALALLTQVAGWQPETVHIGQIPSDWFIYAAEVLQEILSDTADADAASKLIEAAIGSAATIGGSVVSGATATGTATGNATGVLKPGTYAGTTLDQDQCTNAETIYNVGVSKKATTQDIIRAIACALAESSLVNIGYGDAAGPDSAGLFQQRPSAGWGTRAQVLTPSYAAGKFFDALLAIGNRTQLSDAQAIHDVQNNNAALNYRYTDEIPAATAIVNTINKGISSAKQGSFWDAVTGKANNTNSNKQTALNNTGVVDQTTFLNMVVNLYENQHPTYQQLSGTSLSTLTNGTPSGLNVAGLISWAYVQSTGNLNQVPPFTSPSALAVYCNQFKGRKLTGAQGLNTEGAIMFVGKDESSASDAQVSLGNGTQTISMTSAGLKLNTVKSGSFKFSYLLPGVSYPTVNLGNGSTVSSSSSGTTTTSTTNDWAPKELPNPYAIPTDVDPNSKDPIDQQLIALQWSPQPDGDAATFSALLSGPRALLNDVPMMAYFTNIMTAAQRSYCSAPNGDLIAWFPDYFGWYGTAAVMHIQDIELQNFQIQWSDDNLITHYFTAGAPTTQFDTSGGDIAPLTTEAVIASTIGIASVENKNILAMMFGVEPTDDEVKQFGKQFLAKFGARPYFDQLAGIYGPKGEFFTALYRFMQAWTYQFNADVPLTFMPEVWPGMLIVLDSFGFQAYVTTVTHDFQFGQNGSFTTTVNIAAPTRTGNHTPLDFIPGLPVAGTRLPRPSDVIPTAQQNVSDASASAAQSGASG